MRNKEVRQFLLIYLIVTVIATVIAAFISLSAVVLVFTRERDRAIFDLSSQIDSILHGEYDVDLIPDEEGGLAVLSGQYWGEVAGIAARDMDKTYHVSCVFKSGGQYVTTGIIPYSLGKYCESKAAANGDAQQTFAQTTAVYGYYAKQYFASIA